MAESLMYAIVGDINVLAYGYLAGLRNFQCSADQLLPINSIRSKATITDKA